jgi:hypothetical protein
MVTIKIHLTAPLIHRFEGRQRRAKFASENDVLKGASTASLERTYIDVSGEDTTYSNRSRPHRIYVIKRYYSKRGHLHCHSTVLVEVPTDFFKSFLFR